jgi:hypothetical protein
MELICSTKVHNSLHPGPARTPIYQYKDNKKIISNEKKAHCNNSGAFTLYLCKDLQYTI